VTPTSLSYTVRINEQGAQPQGSIFEDVYFQTGYSYDNSKINFTLFTNSIDATLDEYSVSTVYDGTTYNTTIDDSPSGGLVTLTIPYNSTIQNTFDVTYSINSAGSEYSWVETYTVIESNTYDLDFSDMSSKTRVVVAVFTMMLLVAIGMAVAGVIGAHIGGLLGIGLLTLFNILNLATGIIGVTIVITLILVLKKDGDTI